MKRKTFGINSPIDVIWWKRANIIEYTVEWHSSGMKQVNYESAAIATMVKRL